LVLVSFRCIDCFRHAIEEGVIFPLRGFKEIEHSGDAGLEIEGRSIEELFRNAALGLFGLLVRGEVLSKDARRVRVEADCYEDLLVNWLSEIITASAVYAELYSDIYIESVGQYYIDCFLKGEPYDPARHNLRSEVKAATYHDIYVVQKGGRFKARVIFDL